MLQLHKFIMQVFPKSGWALKMHIEGRHIVVGLYWNSKEYPTHETTILKSDMRKLLDGVDKS